MTKWICKQCGHAWTTEVDELPDNCPADDATGLPYIVRLDAAPMADLSEVMRKRVSDDLEP